MRREDLQDATKGKSKEKSKLFGHFIFEGGWGVFLSINYLAGMGIRKYIAEKEMMHVHVHVLKLHTVKVYFEHRFITLKQRLIEKKEMFFWSFSRFLACQFCRNTF